MTNWHFREKRPDDTSRESVSGEFFSNDSLRDGFAQGLIREGIQNSLDAYIPNGSPLRVRIYLSEDAGALRPDQAASFFGALFPHLSSPQNERIDPPTEAEACPFLVFEDFQTKGLRGDVRAWRTKDGKDPFYLFFRSEGDSEKASKDRGRWGIGKFVFPRSSRARTFLGLTVRHSGELPGPLLMGRAILRAHCIGDVDYVPDGYFGLQESIDYSLITTPVSDAKEIAAFRGLFRVSRRSEPGLSVVVPWYIQTEITPRRIVEACIREFYLPICAGRLVVDIESPTGGNVSLDQKKLDGVVSGIGGRFSEEMGPLVRLARFAANSSNRVLLPPVDGSPEWKGAAFPSLCIDQIRTELAHGRPCGIRVQLSVKRKKESAHPSHFDVYLAAEPDSDFAQTHFVRNDLAIPGQRPVHTHGYRSLVHIEEGPLCTLLGDAENPSHTQWNKDGENFRGVYQYGDAHLRFVRQSARRILDFVFGSQEEPDISVLSDFFGRPTAEPAATAPEKGITTRPDGRPAFKKPEPRKPSPVYFRVEERSLGFRICNGPAPLPVDSFLQVRVAYDIPSGNPFSKFEPDDFSLLGEGIRYLEKKGVEVKAVDHNTLRLHVVNATFELAATGFDQYRDLIIHAEVMERPDGSQTN